MGEIIKIDNEKNNEIMQMNHQFIQSVLFDWDKISDESYLTRIEALYKVKKITPFFFPVPFCNRYSIAEFRVRVMR